MATTQTATIRVFWKCPAKGCHSTRVTDLEAYRGKALVPGADGPESIHAPLFGTDRVRADWQAAGLVCEAHDRLMEGKQLQATYNPAKVCDGRCMNARRASCDCSCGGANHGGSHL